MAKTEIKESINNIKIGEFDTSGNKIVNVLAKHNEYAIYEIDSDNIQNRIRVLIDGHTDESEQVIQERFNKVKSDYIRAKGVLFHSTNFETNKQRVAHTLSTCLNSSGDSNNDIFAKLIKSIHEEQNTILKNRLIYIAPCTILITLCVIDFIFLFFKTTPIEKISTYALPLFSSTSLSLIINSNKLNFQEFSKWYNYFFLGLERLFLSACIGYITFILIDSGIIKSTILSSTPYSLTIALLIAGYSERLIPNILTKSESTFNIK